ncbi:hypothetical protein [Mesoterricola silvestris]|uniref:Uncharacterized protein n=1 Tax=Mesoterricola silvestris TaxID=2927979 RepID=A0AA48GKS1_9BACT|nr:hypothetical protein [Mesoterricola silvestris]BDU71564.1 hypothetical protein METEAL_07380 [Mesoterricola silvestris]
MPFDFQRQARSYHQIEHGSRYPRYQAWEFLWEHLQGMGSFRKAASPENIEQTALHLGFFLANWGMLRASSNLPNTNLAFFVDFVRHLDENMPDDFWQLKFDEFRTDTSRAIKLFDQAVNVIVSFDGGVAARISWTETLISKILLGIWGQCPAIDRFYKIGFKLYAKEQGLRVGQNCDGKYLSQLANLAFKNSWPLSGFFSHKKKLSYPSGKVLDMAFFNYGVEHAP